MEKERPTKVASVEGKDKPKKRYSNAKATYPPLSNLVIQLAAFVIRGPALATAVTILIYPYYLQLAQWWPYSEAAFFVAGSLLIHETLYFGVNGFLVFCDYKGWLTSYKLPRTPRMQPSRKLLVDTFKKAFVGHFIIQVFILNNYSFFVVFPFYLFCYSFFLLKCFLMSYSFLFFFSPSPPPSF